MLLVSSGPTGLYSTAAGADVPSVTETATSDFFGRFTTPSDIATESVDKTTTSTAVTAEGTTIEAETPTEAWTSSPELFTSAPDVETSTPTEETPTTVLPTAEETTTLAVDAAEETTSPVATLPEESTTPAPEPTDNTAVDGRLFAVTQNYSTGEEVNIEESTEGEEAKGFTVINTNNLKIKKCK